MCENAFLDTCVLIGITFPVNSHHEIKQSI